MSQREPDEHPSPIDDQFAVTHAVADQDSSRNEANARSAVGSLGFALAFGGLLWIVLPKGYKRTPDSFEISYLGAEVPLLELPVTDAGVLTNAAELQTLFAKYAAGKSLQLPGKQVVRLDPASVRVLNEASGAVVQATAVDDLGSQRGITYSFVPRYDAARRAS